MSNEDHEDGEHITSAAAPVSRLASLTDELLLNIITQLEGKNDVETVKNNTVFRRLGRRFNSLMNNSSDSLGRYHATMSGAGRLTERLHAVVYPRDGLSPEEDFLPRDARKGPSAAEQIGQIAPVLDLLPSGVQSDIVGDINRLEFEPKAAAVKVMCGHLKKLHDEENVASMTLAAVDYLTERGELNTSTRYEGAGAVALGYEHLSPFLMKRLHDKITARPELRPLLAGEILYLNPDVLKHAPARELVLAAAPEMGGSEEKNSIAALLNHTEDFEDSKRSALIDDAINHLEQSRPPPDDVADEIRLRHYQIDTAICNGLARSQNYLTTANRHQLADLKTSHPELGKIWRAALTPDPVERQPANPPAPYTDVTRLRKQFDALPVVQASNGFERVDSATAITKAVAAEVKIARKDLARSHQRGSDRSI